MGRLVLVVDDDQLNRELMETVLKRVGYETRSAFGGNQALTLVKTERPDLILLDARMGDMDGFEVCSRLKSDPATSTIPVIILTASNLASDVRRAEEVNADAYYHKPDGWQGLMERVKALIG